MNFRRWLAVGLVLVVAGVIGSAFVTIYSTVQAKRAFDRAWMSYLQSRTGISRDPTSEVFAIREITPGDSESVVDEKMKDTITPPRQVEPSPDDPIGSAYLKLYEFNYEPGIDTLLHKDEDAPQIREWFEVYFDENGEAVAVTRDLFVRANAEDTVSKTYILRPHKSR